MVFWLSYFCQRLDDDDGNYRRDAPPEMKSKGQQADAPNPSMALWFQVRTAPCLLTLLALLPAGCASFRTKPPLEQPGLVGTWRWVAVDQQPVTQPFHIRFYPDGTAATWPAVGGLAVTNGVSRGRYHLERFLVIETGAGKDDPRTRLEIKGDQMTLINNESNRLYYFRVVPDLEPGK